MSKLRAKVGAEFGATDCVNGAKSGWSDAWLGKPPLTPSEAPNAIWYQAYIVAYYLAKFGPYRYESLPSIIPITMLRLTLGACTFTRSPLYVVPTAVSPTQAPFSNPYVPSQNPYFSYYVPQQQSTQTFQIPGSMQGSIR